LWNWNRRLALAVLGWLFEVARVFVRFDRYANIEINYLFQRIESYRGLAIVATNMRSALIRLKIPT
jgi:hypothetical protein